MGRSRPIDRPHSSRRVHAELPALIVETRRHTDMIRFPHGSQSDHRRAVPDADATTDFTTNHAVDAYLVAAVPLVVTLDPFAVNNDQVLIQDITNDAAAHPITVLASHGQTILNGFGSSLSVAIDGGGVQLTFSRRKAAGFRREPARRARARRAPRAFRGPRAPRARPARARPAPRASEPRAPRASGCDRDRDDRRHGRGHHGGHGSGHDRSDGRNVARPAPREPVRRAPRASEPPERPAYRARRGLVLAGGIFPRTLTNTGGGAASISTRSRRPHRHDPGGERGRLEHRLRSRDLHARPCRPTSRDLRPFGLGRLRGDASAFHFDLASSLLDIVPLNDVSIDAHVSAGYCQGGIAIDGAETRGSSRRQATRSSRSTASRRTSPPLSRSPTRSRPSSHTTPRTTRSSSTTRRRQHDRADAVARFLIGSSTFTPM